MGSVNYVGKKSLVVGIKVVAENLQEGASKHEYLLLRWLRRMQTGPAEVPPLILESRKTCAVLRCASAAAYSGRRGGVYDRLQVVLHGSLCRRRPAFRGAMCLVY